jgi:hypothetical protein
VASETSEWATRYPDLTGKAVVVAGDAPGLIDICAALGRNGSLVAVVCADASVVEAATTTAQRADQGGFGFAADPASPAVWERVTPHIEQRLGPIDVAVVVAPAATRATVVAALLPDMTARGRGVVIESGPSVSAVTTEPGVRHRAIRGDRLSATDLAAAVLFCASDTVVAPSIVVTADQRPA